MTGGFEADVERLATHAKDFDGIVERAGKIAADLDGALEGAATAWGEDVVGQSFSAAHVTQAAETADTVRGLADGLGGIGGSFGAAAQRYRAGESGAVDSLGDAVTGG